jgi:cell wall-associated NlpC family hydrolase
MKLKLVFLFVLISFLGISQNRALKRIELLYNQKNYRLTYWRSDQLLSNPDYDTSLIPMFYKSLSLYHLQGKFLFKNRKEQPWEEASIMLKKIKSSRNASKFITNHTRELSELSIYLSKELDWLKTKNEIAKYNSFSKSIKGLFDGMKLDYVEVKSRLTSENQNLLSEDRKKLIEYAEKCIGVPYLYGGDSLDGFDCSGFVGYVYQGVNLQLGRTSRDQYEFCKKIERSEIQKGDLIFFNSGGEDVTHVGIVISHANEPLKMIHSSSSKGVIITNVDESDYWLKKITGFGRY